MFCRLRTSKERKVNMETQDYAFEPGLTVGELLKSSQKGLAGCNQSSFC